MRPRALAIAAATALALGDVSPAVAEPISPPSRKGATIAKVVVPTAVRSEAGAGTVVWRAGTAISWSGGPQWLLVLGSQRAPDGTEWLRVVLPARANGAHGWLRADDVLLRRTRWRINVSIGRREVTVYSGGRLVRRFRAVVGAPATPTPFGLFAVYDLVPQRPARGLLGPWAIHLTALSNVLDNYGGGPGRIAIHGRGGASLANPLGSARSHGCVRVDNADVAWLARTVPRGTPVQIRP